MVGLTHSVLGWSSSERLDGEYAFVAGLYVAALTAPALVLAVSRVIADAAVLYISLLVAVTGVTAVAGWIVSRTPGMAVTLGRHDAVWLLVVLPFGWFGGVIGGAALGVEPPAIAAPPPRRDRDGWRDAARHHTGRDESNATRECCP